jgi:hypothetical protein
MRIPGLDDDFVSRFEGKRDFRENKIYADVADSATFVVNTLELALTGAEWLFPEKATPELALAIYDRIVRHMDAKAAEAAMLG